MANTPHQQGIAPHQNGIARIVMPPSEEFPGGKHVGMAILIDADHVLTCCHVVNQAIGEEVYSADQPGEEHQLRIRFPYSQNAERTAKVIEWGLQPKSKMDAVVLKLNEPAPPEVGHAEFSMAHVKDRSWSCIGFDSEGNDHEAQGTLGTVLSDLSGGYRQLNGTAGRAVQIEKGYSGASLWCKEENACVGMVVSKDRDHALTGASYAIIPSELNRLETLQLQFARRPQPQPPWTRIALLIASLSLAVLAYCFWPQPIVAQIFDAETKDRIFRKFQVQRDSCTQFTKTGAYEIDLHDPGFYSESKGKWKVICSGFDGESLTVEESSRPLQLFIRRVAITEWVNDENYLSTIKLDRTSSAEELGITDNNLLNAIQSNEVLPKDVILRVYNKSGKFHADVLLIPYNPKNESIGNTQIPLWKIPPQKWSEPFESFTIPDCIFLAGVSYHGVRAEAVDWAPLYLRKYVKLEIDFEETTGKPSGKFTSHQDDPFSPPNLSTQDQ